MNKNRAYSILLILIMGLTLPGILRAEQVISSKSLALHLDEDSGRFYLENPDPGKDGLRFYTFRDNPPTSYITLIMNGNPYRLISGAFTDISYFKQAGQIISGKYMLDKVIFTIRFILTNSSPEAAFDSILMLVDAENRSPQAITVGSRFLLDTTYDEAKGTPQIYLSSTELMSQERLILNNVLPEFIYTGPFDQGSSGFGNGLYIFPEVNSLQPESIIIGNWKKLDDIELDYKVRPADQFRSATYGSKDAAIALFFDKIPVKSGEKVTFGILISRSPKPSNAIQEISAVSQLDLTQPVVKVQNVISNTNQNKIIKAEVSTTNLSPTNQKSTALVQKNEGKMIITNFVTLPDFSTNQASHSEAQLLLQSQLQLIEKMNAILEKISTLSNQKSVETRVVTNYIKPPENMVPETEVVELQQDYEKQLKEQQEKYQKLLDQQKSDMETSIKQYEDQIKHSTSQKNKTEAVNRLDQVIREMDQKIKVIEELEKLRLDFKTMPQEKLDELNLMLEEIEKKIVKYRYE